MTFSKNESLCKQELQSWQLTHLQETLERVYYLTQTASCKYGLKVALDSIKSRGRRDYGARYYNSLLFN
ncbi:MAG: hypothetical protein PHW07_08295 [Sulfurospirillaceae bacterium]|nr:hypothetical protein [Sulfurospirillaceae bacterium]